MESESTHVFELSYIYDMGDDKISGCDDFTFDILGYAMAYVGEFKATITFPEDIDLSSVSLRTNDRQSWSPSAEESVKINGNAITVQTGTRQLSTTVHRLQRAAGQAAEGDTEAVTAVPTAEAAAPEVAK